MPSLDDVYRKFGEVAEAAQLLETHLGTIVMQNHGAELNWYFEPNSKLASELHARVNRQTLGQLITGAKQPLDDLLAAALRERNRLSHSFYREHNFRRNSEDGQAIMLSDLESMHDVLIKAYKAVLLLNGIDIDALVASSDTEFPTEHVKI